MSDIEIISHPLCPLAQRLVLIGVLAGKAPGADAEITYLAYPTLSKTAPLHSPTGELPILKLSGTAASTSTEHMAEFLDAQWGAELLPSDPAERLRVRGIERSAGAALDKLRGVFTARDATGLDAAFASLFPALAEIERALDEEQGPDTLTRMDFVALAPLASLTGEFAAVREHPGWKALPKLAARMAAYRSDERVAASRCPDYAREFEAFFAMTGSAFPSLAGASSASRPA